MMSTGDDTSSQDFAIDAQSLTPVEKFAAFWISPNDCNVCATWRAAAVVGSPLICLSVTYGLRGFIFGTLAWAAFVAGFYLHINRS